MGHFKMASDMTARLPGIFSARKQQIPAARPGRPRSREFHSRALGLDATPSTRSSRR